MNITERLSLLAYHFHKAQSNERQAPEKPEKKETHKLTGYRSQLPHAEIFVTQLIARPC